MQTGTTESDQDPVAAVSRLADDVADVINGYETMIERAEADLQPYVERLHALHKNHETRLLECLADRGSEPENPGSFMSAVHETVATARDWFGKLDDSALDGIIDGEERLIARYRQTARDTEGEPSLHEVVVDQQVALSSQVDAIKTS